MCVCFEASNVTCRHLHVVVRNGASEPVRMLHLCAVLHCVLYCLQCKRLIENGLNTYSSFSDLQLYFHSGTWPIKYAIQHSLQLLIFYTARKSDGG